MSTPLTDFAAGETYQGFDGFLYPGTNQRPPAHDALGLTLAGQVVPRDAAGNPASPSHGNFQKGGGSAYQIGLISIGMSNASYEFGGIVGGDHNAFIWKAQHDPACWTYNDANRRITLVNGASPKEAGFAWDDPNSVAWSTLSNRVSAAGLSPAQVQICWMKMAELNPQQYGAFPLHAERLRDDIGTIARTLRSKYPNCVLCYLSSRIFAYTSVGINPEPYAYESGFSDKWIIEQQMDGDPDLNCNPSVGAAVAPWLAWGPYLWADDGNPRSDGLVWLRSDLNATDGTHPTESGVFKVSDALLGFFKTDSTAVPWMLK